MMLAFIFSSCPLSSLWSLPTLRRTRRPTTDATTSLCPSSAPCVTPLMKTLRPEPGEKTETLLTCRDIRVCSSFMFVEIQPSLLLVLSKFLFQKQNSSKHCSISMAICSKMWWFHSLAARSLSSHLFEAADWWLALMSSLHVLKSAAAVQLCAFGSNENLHWFSPLETDHVAVHSCIVSGSYADILPSASTIPPSTDLLLFQCSEWSKQSHIQLEESL